MEAVTEMRVIMQMSPLHRPRGATRPGRWTSTYMKRKVYHLYFYMHLKLNYILIYCSLQIVQIIDCVIVTPLGRDPYSGYVQIGYDYLDETIVLLHSCTVCRDM